MTGRGKDILEPFTQGIWSFHFCMTCWLVSFVGPSDSTGSVLRWSFERTGVWFITSCPKLEAVLAYRPFPAWSSAAEKASCRQRKSCFYRVWAWADSRGSRRWRIQSVQWQEFLPQTAHSAREMQQKQRPLDPAVFVGLFLYKICESWSSHFSCFQGIVRTEKNSPVESDCAWLIWKDLLEKLVEDQDIWGMVLVLNWIFRASLNFQHQTIRRRRSGLGVNASMWRIERVRAGKMYTESLNIEMGWNEHTQSLKSFGATIAQREACCSWILRSDPTGCYTILAEVWISKLTELDSKTTWHLRVKVVNRHPSDLFAASCLHFLEVC